MHATARLAGEPEAASPRIHPSAKTRGPRRVDAARGRRRTRRPRGAQGGRSRRRVLLAAPGWITANAAAGATRRPTASGPPPGAPGVHAKAIVVDGARAYAGSDEHQLHVAHEEPRSRRPRRRTDQHHRRANHDGPRDWLTATPLVTRPPPVPGHPPTCPLPPRPPPTSPPARQIFSKLSGIVWGWGSGGAGGRRVARRVLRVDGAAAGEVAVEGEGNALDFFGVKRVGSSRSSGSRGR